MCGKTTSVRACGHEDFGSTGSYIVLVTWKVCIGDLFIGDVATRLAAIHTIALSMSANACCVCENETPGAPRSSKTTPPSSNVHSDDANCHMPPPRKHARGDPWDAGNSSDSSHDEGKNKQAVNTNLQSRFVDAEAQGKLRLPMMSTLMLPLLRPLQARSVFRCGRAAKGIGLRKKELPVVRHVPVGGTTT